MEMLVATAAAVVVAGALLGSLIGLRKSFVATERYTIAQTAQARLLEYVSRDLRTVTGTSGIVSPAISTGSYASIGSVVNPGATVTASSVASGTLTLVVPGYYANGKGAAPNVFIYKSGSMAYGKLVSGTATATTGTIQYFKVPQNYGNPLAGYDSYWRYVRVETAGATSGTTTIVEKADGMLLDLVQSGTGIPAAYTVRVRFNPSFKFSSKGPPSEPIASGTYVSASQYVLLRGTN
jgi:hypothetical protein